MKVYRGVGELFAFGDKITGEFSGFDHGADIWLNVLDDLLGVVDVFQQLNQCGNCEESEGERRRKGEFLLPSIAWRLSLNCVWIHFESAS